MERVVNRKEKLFFMNEGVAGLKEDFSNCMEKFVSSIEKYKKNKNPNLFNIEKEEIKEGYIVFHLEKEQGICFNKEETEAYKKDCVGLGGIKGECFYFSIGGV